jgi:hypothetical protein
LTLATILSLLTGCSTTPTTAQQHHDPLHGIMTPPGQVPKPNGAPHQASPGYASPPADGISAMPTSLSATNNVSMAGASWKGPLGRPLAIDDNGRPYVPGQNGRPPMPGVPAPNPHPKVEPVPDVGMPAAAPTGNWKPPQIPAAAASPPTEETLFRQLQSRGVLQQKQDAVPDGVRLTCYVPRGDGGGLRALEVTAASYSAAAQSMLQQLDAPR